MLHIWFNQTQSHSMISPHPSFPFRLLPSASLWHDRLFSCLWLLIIENFLGAFSVCIWKMYLKRKHFQLICQRHCSHKRKTATEFYLFILSMASGSSCHYPSTLCALHSLSEKSKCQTNGREKGMLAGKREGKCRRANKSSGSAGSVGVGGAAEGFLGPGRAVSHFM